VILVDANLLVYAHVGSVPQHDRARSWLDGALGGVSRVGLPWPSLLGFLRLVTNPRVFRRPEPMADAWAQVAAWLEDDGRPVDIRASVMARLASGALVTMNACGSVGAGMGSNEAKHLAQAAVEELEAVLQRIEVFRLAAEQVEHPEEKRADQNPGKIAVHDQPVLGGVGRSS